jgi:hypothetical protein
MNALVTQSVPLIISSEPTKTSRRWLEDGTKVRVSKKTGQLIPKPDPLFDRKPRSSGTLPCTWCGVYCSILFWSVQLRLGMHVI